MFDTVCTLPLSSDLFTQAIHPKEPVVSVGLAAGHVQTFRLPLEESDSDDDDASTSSSRNGKGHIDTMWRTRRHKGSCRCLAFSVDGEMLYSAGTDGLVKMAKAESGQVQNKIAIPLEKNGYDVSACTRRQCISWNVSG
jgi:WD40 repeat protein